MEPLNTPFCPHVEIELRIKLSIVALCELSYGEVRLVMVLFEVQSRGSSKEPIVYMERVLMQWNGLYSRTFVFLQRHVYLLLYG